MKTKQLSLGYYEARKRMKSSHCENLVYEVKEVDRKLKSCLVLLPGVGSINLIVIDSRG